MLKIFKCLRCGHEWPSKQEHPRVCPKCKSPYWDKERKYIRSKGAFIGDGTINRAIPHGLGKVPKKFKIKQLNQEGK